MYVKSWNIGWNVSADCFSPPSVYASLPYSYICVLLTSSAATGLSMWAMNSYHWGENCHSIFCVISLMMPLCLLRAWNIKSLMIMMMITMAAMIIIIKSTSSIFVVVIFILWSAAFIYSEYEMANSIFNKSKNPAEVVHYVFKQCISSMRQNLYSSP